MLLTIFLLIVLLIFFLIIVRLTKYLLIVVRYFKARKFLYNDTKNSELSKKQVEDSERFDLENILIWHEGLWVPGSIIYVLDCLNHYEKVEINPRKHFFYKLMEQKLILSGKLVDVNQNIERLEKNNFLSLMDKFYAMKTCIKKKTEIQYKQKLTEIKLELYRLNSDMDYDPEDKERPSLDEID